MGVTHDTSQIDPSLYQCIYFFLHLFKQELETWLTYEVDYRCFEAE